MSNTQFLDKIDAAIAEKNLLNHPFYQDWQAGNFHANRCNSTPRSTTVTSRRFRSICACSPAAPTIR